MLQPWVKLVVVEMQQIHVSYHYFLFSTCAFHPMNQAGFQSMILLAHQSESRHQLENLFQFTRFTLLSFPAIYSHLQMWLNRLQIQLQQLHWTFTRKLSEICPRHHQNFTTFLICEIYLVSMLVFVLQHQVVLKRKKILFEFGETNV